MLDSMKSWNKSDWATFLYRSLWMISPIVLISTYYHDNVTLPLWACYAVVLPGYAVPLILRQIGDKLYLYAEFICNGSLAFFFAYQLGQTSYFIPCVLLIAFYSYGRTYQITGPLAVLLVPLLELYFTNTPKLDIITNLLGYTLLYLFGFTLQKLVVSNQTLHQKLAIIRKQYQILEQYSSQIERMTLLEERNRMARELHDTIGHTFTSMMLGLEALHPFIHEDNGKTKLEKLMRLTRTGLDDVRHQVHQMGSPDEELPLNQLLAKLIEEFTENTGITVKLREIGEPYPFVRQIKWALYRCVQEALTNAIRHGQATSVLVILHFDGKQTLLQIQDNGTYQGQIQYGFGLSTMEQRLSALQGSLHVDSSPEEGTIVTCTVPNQSHLNENEIKILLVDDQPLIRESLSLLLDAEKDFQVLTAENGKEAIALCESERPHIVLMDVQMPEMDGIAATTIIKEKMPQIHVILITTVEELPFVQKAMQIGAEGYLLKTANVKEVAAAIRLVYCGGSIISQDVANHWLQGQGREEALSPSLDDQSECLDKPKNRYKLTERELEVLEYLSKGHRYKTIASKLFLTEGTVRNYVSSIYSKMQVRNRSEAVDKAQNEQLFS